MHFSSIINLTQQRYFALVCYAEHRSFCWDQPGRARHGYLASVGGQEVFSNEQKQNRGAQGEATIKPPFLWILSGDCAKEIISP